MKKCYYAFTFLMLSTCVFAHDFSPSAADFGGTGLLQIPTARLYEDGEVAISYSQILPYTHGSLTFVPISWLEANIRYTSINNRDYGKQISNQDYKDKGIDFKFSLLDEDYYQPQLALGFRDIGGTGLFSSEYVVASKRFDNFDFTLGLGWGYLGASSHIKNPLSYVFGKDFEERAGNTHKQGGTVNTQSWFHGPMQVFGGIEYQTPWQPLALKVEYDGNNYQHEPKNNPQTRQSPINIGATYAINDALTLQLGLERGNTAMLGFTLHDNFGRSKGTPKLSDPNPEPLKKSTEAPNWKNVSTRIDENAGFKVNTITERHKEIVINGSNKKYQTSAKSMGRIARIIDNSAAENIEWITVVNENNGLKTAETSFSREAFVSYINHDNDISAIKDTLTETTPNAESNNILYKQLDKKRFDYGAGLGYKQSIGGPDSFILYQFTADGDISYDFKPNFWFSGGLSIGLLDNYDNFVYDAPSKLPRVRTYVRQYLTSSNVMVPFFQITNTHQLSDNIYAMTYGGLLESMYSGVGGEVLYRPFGERYAFGIDVNWVKQRAFEQDFNFRDYETVTGHISHYWNIGYKGVLVTTSVGRYLAKDYGVTLDISRTFPNGVVMGGFTTKTNVSAAEFGEGSFDKGIYISIPFDLLTTTSTLMNARINWNPLTRDGGAKLNRRYNLYNITEERNLDKFHQGLPQINE